MEVRSLPFSQTWPSLGSRSAIILRNRLLPDPDGPVTAAHAPVPRFSSNGPANLLRSSFTSSAASIEFPACKGGRDRESNYLNRRFSRDSWLIAVQPISFIPR